MQFPQVPWDFPTWISSSLTFTWREPLGSTSLLHRLIASCQQQLKGSQAPRSSGGLPGDVPGMEAVMLSLSEAPHPQDPLQVFGGDPMGRAGGWRAVGTAGSLSWT